MNSASPSSATSAPLRGTATARTLSLASAMEHRHRQKLRAFAPRQEQAGGDRELLARVVAVAGPRQRLAPFQMQASPVGGVARRLLELRGREVGAVLCDQRLAPHFQRIGEM